jgi:hypothetical protein
MGQQRAVGAQVGADEPGGGAERHEGGAKAGHEQEGIREDSQLLAGCGLACHRCRSAPHVADIRGDKRQDAG